MCCFGSVWCCHIETLIGERLLNDECNTMVLLSVSQKFDLNLKAESHFHFIVFHSQKKKKNKIIHKESPGMFPN